MLFGASMFFTDYSMGAGELAQALEQRGFESVWAPEHSHIPVSRNSAFPSGGELPKQYHDVMDPFVSLTYAAAVTKTIKVGTGVCLVAQRDPIQTAKLVASLDQVSGGRFLFGVGGGWNADEMADHGTEFKTRFKLMRERIEAMKEIWTKPKPEYHGEMVDFPPMMSVAQAGAAAAPAGDHRRHVPACGAAGDPLRRRLDPAFAPAAIRGRDRLPAAIPPDGRRGRARPRHLPGHGVGHPARYRPGAALHRPRGQPRRRATDRRQGRQDHAACSTAGPRSSPNCNRARPSRAADNHGRERWLFPG